MASDAMPYLTGADANVRAMVPSIVNGDSSGGNKTLLPEEDSLRMKQTGL